MTDSHLLLQSIFVASSIPITNYKPLRAQYPLQHIEKKCLNNTFLILIYWVLSVTLLNIIKNGKKVALYLNKKRQTH